MGLKLLPSLKEKKRYVAYEVISDNKVNYTDTKDSIIENYKKYFGIIGLAKADLMVLEDWKNQKGIIKVNNKHTDELKMSLGLTKKINNQNVILRCLGISGMINKARKRYL
ncbi:MAG: hypothetical protein KJ623_02980 [Nanoarchaeota archaeon]|nr:hypothetical protein [Nanoarchaeota archaeon]MBU0962396.1 hypothetical protein [Nanoarchaeota archaeon]